jgi:hypothetical protein
MNAKLIQAAKNKGQNNLKLTGILNAYVLYSHLVKQLEESLQEYVKTGVLDDSITENCACPKSKGEPPLACPVGGRRKTVNTRGR